MSNIRKTLSREKVAKIEKNMRFFKTWTFRPWEMSLLKLCLISCGILLGIYFHEFVIELTWFWWTLFAATTAYFMARFFGEQ